MKRLVVASLLFAACGVASATTVVTNSFNGSGILPLGESDTTTYGSVFTTPNAADTKLDSFSFFLKSITGTSRLFGGVAQWTGTGAGPALFSSASFSAVYPDWTEVTVNTGGLNLTAGTQYVAYFSAAGLFDGAQDSVYMGLSNDSNTLGMSWDNSNGGFPNHNNWLGCQACSQIQDAGSMSFSAPSNVPEPASLALLGLGLAGLRLGRRRKG